MVDHLRVEHDENPLGLGTRTPRLSWWIHGDARGIVQAEYQVQVARTADDLTRGRNLVWDSKRVKSSESTLRPYDGPAVESRHRYYWQVRVWDATNRESAWSAAAWWEMGLLDPSDWTAQWIEPDLQEDTSMPQPSPMLRRAFALKRTPRSARAYVTSHGLYELSLNGQRVGDEVLTPGWTSYNKRLQYQTYDVTTCCARGDNAVGALLGSGWYRGTDWIQAASQPLRRSRWRCWCSSTSPIPTARRETIVIRRAVEGGDRSDSDLRDLRRRDLRRAAREAGLGRARLRRRELEGRARRRASEEHADRARGPARPSHRGADAGQDPQDAGGETVVDMGQNMVGWVRLTVEGPAGTTVTLRHAEVLDKDGNFYTDNLRAAAQQVAYTLKGGGREVFEPRFTFQGFRYVAGRRLSRAARARQPDGRRRPLGDGARRRVRDLEAADQPAAAQHPLGTEGQLPRRPHRLPAARRAAGLDGRRAGVLAHGRLQHGRGGLLHQVAEGRRRRSARVRQRPARRAGRADATGQAGGRVGRVGRRRRDHPVEHVPELRRHACPRDAVPEHGELGRVHAARAGDDYLWTETSLRRLARLRDDALGLPGGDDGQGPDRDGVLRAFDRPARAHRAVLGKTDDRARYEALLRHDQGGLREGVRDARRACRREHADGVRAGAAVRPAAEELRPRAATRLAAEDARRGSTSRPAFSARRTCCTC